MSPVGIGTYDGMKYLFRNNKNCSLHSNRLLFKPDKIDHESKFTAIGYPLLVNVRVPVSILIDDLEPQSTPECLDYPPCGKFYCNHEISIECPTPTRSTSEVG
jgi:hypothetical protein